MGSLRLNFIELIVEDDCGSERSFRRQMWATGMIEAGTGKLAEDMHLGKSNCVTCSEVETVLSCKLTSLVLSPSVNDLLPISMALKIREETIVVYTAINFYFYLAYDLKWL